MSSNLQLFVDLMIALLLIMAVSRGVGSLFIKLGQPRVVGEMVSGVILGPTVFGFFAPDLMNEIFSQDVKPILYILSNLGLSIYMFLIGSELDLNSFNKKSLRNAGALAGSGIFPPFIMGVGIAILLYKSISLPTLSMTNFAIYLGVALSITAFPMLARILQDEKLVKTRIGSLTLLAASVDDAVAWCLLAVVTAMAQAKSMMSGLYTALLGILFVLIVMYVIKPLMKRVGDKVQKTGVLTQGIFGIVMMLILASAWFTDYIGIYSVFGGFILGLAMPRNSVFQHELHQKFSDIVVVFLLPIFFTYSGLNANLLGIFNLQLFVPMLIILAASFIGKFGGCTLAMKKLGFSWRESSAIGSLMNARGLMELIVVNIGLTYGMISKDLYSILVLMAVITTAGAMPLYRFFTKKSALMNKQNPSDELRMKRATEKGA